MNLNTVCNEEREFRGGAICCVGTDAATWTVGGRVYQKWLNAEKLWMRELGGSGETLCPDVD